LLLLTLIAVSAIAIDGNFQNRDGRNRGFSIFMDAADQRGLSVDNPWRP